MDTDWEDLSVIKDPVVIIDILKEDVLLRYFASFKSKEMDRLFMESALRFSLRQEDKDVPEWVCQPNVLCTLTNTPIAVANQPEVWEYTSDEGMLAEEESLGNGWTRLALT